MSKITILGILILTATILPASFAEAQSYRDRDRYSQQNWSRFWNSDEGADFDREEVRRWREENNRVRDAVNDLDDDPVDNLHIPILFGVSVSDLYPNFGDPRDGGDRQHEGLDMLAAKGTPIVSPTEAVVIRIGDGSGSGLYVSTANPGEETFVYMHLTEVADIDEGDKLQAGDIIGYVGNTGNASGGAAHLHFEIREDHEPTDPIERLTREFSLEDKMEFLEEILDDADNADELAEFLVSEYQNLFIQAGIKGIEVPNLITETLPVTAKAAVTSGVPAYDIQLGDSGPGVVALQSRLIAGGYLVLSSPTDWFGPMTQSALIAYQRAEGVSPASGYYGPLTRASMGANSSTSTSQKADAMTRAQLIAEIERLLELIEQRSN